MSETKFTPGPWEWMGDTLAPSDAPWNAVIEVEDQPRSAYSELQSGELAIANPHDRPLLGAATDLYAAAEAALALLTGDGLDGTLGHHKDNPIPAMLRDALAKARGEETP